jgi:hypothetical protein
MRIDYWTYVSQPYRFNQLYELFLDVQNKAENEQYKAQQKQVEKAKRNAR